VDGALVCLPVWGGNMSRKTSERTRLRIARRRRHSAFVHLFIRIRPFVVGLALLALAVWAVQSLLAISALQ